MNGLRTSQETGYTWAVHQESGGPLRTLPMRYDDDDILQQIEGLRTYRKGQRRAPHKPLLLLFAIAELLQGRRRLPFSAVEAALTPLLNAYAPPVVGRHQPELPYWHLSTDGLWRVEDAAALARQASGFPTMSALRESAGSLPGEFAERLLANPRLVHDVVTLLLEEHFAPSVHEDILAAVGLVLDAPAAVAERPERATAARSRDPRFRDAVLRAYEYRCAFSGFRAALGGAYFGCEAAHVQWHAHEGPDSVSNGIALEPTVHKLFDAGAWSLTDDRRILVSAEFTGTDRTVARIREHHGKPLRSPLPGEPILKPEYIQWHREPDLGGVFRLPALPL